MIDIQICSKRPEGAKALAISMRETGLFAAGAILSVVASPEVFVALGCEGNDLEGCFYRVTPEPEFDKTQPAPMFRLRREAHRAFDNTGLPWMIFDDDDTFREGIVAYLEEAIADMNLARSILKRPTFLGTAGNFGSNHSKHLTHVSPVNALMPKGHGLIFDDCIWLDEKFDSNLTDFDQSVGGLEEATFCALASSFFSAVPLKKFRSPAKIKFRKAEDREKSAIHDYSVWEKNNMRLIGLLAMDTNWRYPRDMKDRGAGASNSPKPLVKRAKKFKEQLEGDSRWASTH